MLKINLLKFKKKIIFVSMLIVLLALAWTQIISAEDQLNDEAISLENFSMSIAEIAERVGPAVVNVDTVRMVTQQSPFGNDPIFERFFGEQFKEYSRTFPQKGTGSGFIINKEGYILTNEHVVHRADEIKVTMADGREFTGKVIGSDQTSDLAIVKIESDNNLPIVELGDSEGLRVGEIVIAIGNPYGLQQTVTMGVVSAKGRNIPAGIAGQVYRNFIQTDTAINPGNSGGPLLNTKGEVIGVNTAIIPYAQGIGFAIPINTAKRNIDDLINLGRVRRSWLGVYIQEVTPEIAEQFNLSEAKGVLVGQVIEDSPAEDSGILRGDIIIKVNEKEVNTPAELQEKIRSIEIGNTANIRILRDGKNLSFTVKIDEVPTENEGESAKEKVFSVQTGLMVDKVTKEIAQELGLPRVEGLVITEVIPGSSADDRGLKAGDVILEANRIEMSSLQKWDDMINTLKPENTLLLLVYRDYHTYYVPIKVEKVD